MHLKRRAGAQTVCSIATTATILACGLSGCVRNDLKWTEDVKLPDGRVVNLGRYAEFKGGASHLGDPSTESLQRFEFKHPGTGELVRWESSERTGRLTTIALWLDQETPRLLARPSYGGDEFRFKCPNPPYLLFEHVQGGWRSVQLAQIGIERLRANMTTHLMERGLRERIQESGLHLDANRTADSYTYRDGNIRVPYVLDFRTLPDQTFDEKNCDRQLNDLLAKEDLTVMGGADDVRMWGDGTLQSAAIVFRRTLPYIAAIAARRLG